MAADGLSRMDPSEFGEYLRIAREAREVGLLVTEIPTADGPIKIAVAGHTAVPADERSQSPLTPDEELPELAFDPIARRRAMKAQT